MENDGRVDVYVWGSNAEYQINPNEKEEDKSNVFQGELVNIY